VTTPQEVALSDVRKAYSMFEQLQVPVLGIVENMSYFECAHGERYHLFGNGGGEALAERYEVPFLGAVPISMSIREGGDLGIPVVVSQPESLQARALSDVASQVAAQVSIGALNAKKALPVLKMTR